MSHIKLDQTFPTVQDNLCKLKFLKIILVSLRKDFGKKPSSIKEIAKLIRSNPRTVKNWYGASNMPNIYHFIVLLAHSKTLQKFLSLYLKHLPHFENSISPGRHIPRMKKPLTNKFSLGHLTLKNVPMNNLSTRHLWILEMLTIKKSINATCISVHFKINIKTARRDIKYLKNNHYIQFTGSKRYGTYELL